MSIVRVRGPGRDKYNDPKPGAPDRLTLPAGTPPDGSFTAPRTSEDVDVRGRNAGVIVGLTLIAPLGTDIIATDLIEVDGTPYEIEGDPGSWRNPFTNWEAGMSVALKRAAG